MPMAGSDAFRIRCYAKDNEENEGAVEFATGDDIKEGFYFRQYKYKSGDPFAESKRELCLLDADGNTTIPGIVKINSGDHRPLQIFDQGIYTGEHTINVAIGQTYNQCAFFGYGSMNKDDEHAFALMRLNHLKGTPWSLGTTPVVKTWKDKITLEHGDVYIDKNLSVSGDVSAANLSVTGNVTADNLYAKDEVEGLISSINTFNNAININTTVDVGLNMNSTDDYNAIRLGKRNKDTGEVMKNGGAFYAVRYDAEDPYAYIRLTDNGSPEFRIKKTAIEFTGGKLRLTNTDANEIVMPMAGSDCFRIRCSGETDSGGAEIATSDNGNEAIYVRQYLSDGENEGSFHEVKRELCLLDADGKTTLPGSLKVVNGNTTLTNTGANVLDVFRNSTKVNHEAIMRIGINTNECGYIGYNRGGHSGITDGYLYIKQSSNTGTAPIYIKHDVTEFTGNVSISKNLSVTGDITAPIIENITGNITQLQTDVTQLQVDVKELQELPNHTITHRTNVSGEIGTFCETNGGIYDGYEKIGETNCICQVVQSTVLNPKIVGIITSDKQFASHGDVLVKVVPGTYQLGDILCPDITGKARVATDTEMQYMMLHAIPRPKITSLATGIPNVVACFIM